jgi:hypothetical protein
MPIVASNEMLPSLSAPDVGSLLRLARGTPCPDLDVDLIRLSVIRTLYAISGCGIIYFPLHATGYRKWPLTALRRKLARPKLRLPPP